MTQHNDDIPTAQWDQPTAPDGPPESKKGWSRRRKIVVGGVAAFVIVGGIGAAAGGGSDTETADVNASPTSVSAPTPVEQAVADTAVPEAPATATQVADTTTKQAPAPVTEQAPATPSLTSSQRNAVRAGETYLDMMGMSKQGLIGQLSSDAGDGFSVEDATVAVNHIEQQGDVDWNAEAVEAGQAYLDMMGMSRSGLIQQLTSDAGDQFTVEQATYAADQLGV
ncbi:Ltp family lipoprotein [Gordonia sp. LSe1-13]|uniref:Ltp family lipoprotein n=1 Tax=Gordonia sesuvii TaxID=3116777 RepID=A0ABU7MFI8_9ACTN|nr:Ltp family lipoprotein [Gordonia sp. LSe1-13]